MPTDKKNPTQNDENEDPEINDEEEDEGDEVQEPPRTEFMNMVEALEGALQNLSRMPQLNPQSLRLHMQNDLYPILIDLAKACDWYTGDLHQRVTNVEEEVGDSGEEGLSPEFAEQLIEFIGISLQLFGVLVNVCKNDASVIEKVQLLIAQAPGIIAKIRDITMVEDDEDEDEDEEEDEEEPEVMEPRGRQVTSSISSESTPVSVDSVQAAPAPEPEPAQPTAATPNADVVPVSSTVDVNPDDVQVTSTADKEPSNG